MKIGQFAKENQMTIDAVRHYMSLDLLLPVKQSGQYVFDDNCFRDLSEVKRLKDMGFSLSEVQSLMLIQRMAKHTPYEKEQFYLSFFERRLTWIDEERKRLKGMKKAIEAYLSTRMTLKKKSEPEGLPLEVLPYMCCAKCGGQLTVASGTLLGGQIITGHMSCSCGESYPIDKGILIGTSSLEGDVFNAPKTNDLEDQGYHNLTAYLLNYLQETHYDYLSRIVQNFDWMSKVVDFKQKVALELGTGSGFFLRYFLDQMPKDSLYIAVDKDYERLITLKDTLDGISYKPKIVYMCTDFANIPIRDGVVDMLVDYGGSSNYGFDHKGYLFDEIKVKLQEGATFISSFILFQNFVFGSRIPLELRHQFSEEDILAAMDETGYCIDQMLKTDAITKGGRFEDYFLKGESIYSLTAFGRLR